MTDQYFSKRRGEERRGKERKKPSHPSVIYVKREKKGLSGRREEEHVHCVRDYPWVVENWTRIEA